jgi:hypothetical protein
MTPAELLAAAREIMRRADPITAGLWPRAAALLGRQALEGALEDLWRRKRVDLAGCPARIQLLCLPTYLGDAGLAARAAYAWAFLSHACHHRAYDLAPTATELTGWLQGVADLVDAAAAPPGEGRPSSAGP